MVKLMRYEQFKLYYVWTELDQQIVFVFIQ